MSDYNADTINYADISNEKTQKQGRSKASKYGKIAGIATALLFLLVLLISQSVVITHANEYRVIRQFGKIISVRSEPGPSFKVPFLQEQSSISKAVMLYDLPISDVITKDKKTMVADSFVLWKVEDPTKFIQSLNGSMPNAESRIGNIVYNSMKNVISSLQQAEMISGRDSLAIAINQNIGNSLDQYGIRLVAVETKHLDLPSDNKQAVYERMISERNNIAAAYTAEGNSAAKKIRNDTDKIVKIKLSEAQAKADTVIAEGEAEYMKTLSAAYNDPSRADFYSFVRSLDAAKISLTGSDTTLILSKDSPIAQIFNNKD